MKGTSRVTFAEQSGIVMARRTLVLWVIALFVCLAGIGCRSADPDLYPAKPGEPTADIVVLNNHWHTTLLFASDDLPTDFRDELGDTGQARYVAFGWGDEDFFRAEEVSAGMALRALLFSRGSMMLVFGLDDEPENMFESDRVIRITTSRAGMWRTLAAVRASFADENGKLIDAGPGIDGGRFFEARGRYAFYHTCNQWTADCLAAGGMPISAFYATTADNVAWQLCGPKNPSRRVRPLWYDRGR